MELIRHGGVWSSFPLARRFPYPPWRVHGRGHAMAVTADRLRLTFVGLPSVTAFRTIEACDRPGEVVRAELRGG